MKYTSCSIFFVFVSILLIISCKDSGFTGKMNKFTSDTTGLNYQYDDDDDEETESGLTNDIYDQDGDGTISEEEFESLTQRSSSDDDDDDDDDDNSVDNPFGPISAILHRGEWSCTSCKAIITLKLVRIGNKDLSSNAIEKATTQIIFKSSGDKVEISGSNYICPTTNVVARYEMSISYKGSTIPSTDRSILLGARDPDKNNKIYIGLADVKESNYAFHNVDTLIGSVMCPDAKRIAIKNLCRDRVLETNKQLIGCWMTQGIDYSCPKNNWYGKNEYPAQCKEETW